MSNLQRDQNNVPVAGGISSTDSTVILPWKVDPDSGRLLVSATGGGGGGAVFSVFTRTGDVVATTGDYTWNQIDKTVSNIADITTKSHTSLTDIGVNTHPQIDTHIADLNNPHQTTAAQVSAVALTGNESVAGIKSFTSYPQGPGTAPTIGAQLTDKTYVDTLVTTGGRFAGSVTTITTTALPTNIYSNGASGVGATLTGSINGAFPTVNGIAAILNNTYLVRNESTQANNGQYVLTQVGDGGTPYILTRSAGYDQSAEIVAGTFFNILMGTLFSNTQWAMTTTGTITVGTTAIVFDQLSAPTTYTASLGVQLVGTDFRSNLSASGAITLTGNSMQVAVDNSSIEIATNALRVKGLGITNAMLAGSITAAKLVGTDITTVGTIATGTWNATTIATTKGGTGLTSYTTGDLPYATATNTLGKLAIGTLGQQATVGPGNTIVWQTPTSNAGANAITYSKSLDTNSTPSTFSNTASETAVYTYSVAGNALGTNKVIQGTVQGTYLQNSGGTKTLTVRLKYGSTTIATAVSAAIAASATAGTYQVQFILGAQNSASVQQGQVILITESGTAIMSTVYDNGVSAENSTGALNLVISLQLSAATATQTITQRLATTNMLNAADSIGVPVTRAINTTSPLSGGGTLASDITLTTSMATNKLIGRGTAGTGVMEEITIGTGLSLSGTTLNASGGGMSIGGTVTSGTTGSLLFVNSGPVLAQDNSNLFWDDTNNRLGVGTNTSLGVPVTVSGSNAGIALRRDSSNTDRLNMFIGNGSGGFSSDEAYIQGTNVGIHFMNSSTEALGIINLGAGVSAVGIGGVTSVTSPLTVTGANSGLTLRRNSSSTDRLNIFVGNGSTPTIGYNTSQTMTPIDSDNYIFSVNTDLHFWTTGPAGEIMILKNSGNVGINDATATAKFNVLSTTEQMRIQYDASNYYKTTVGSTGGVTFDAVGSGSAFTFSDPVTITNLTLPTNGQILLTVPATDGHATGPTTSGFNSGYSSTAVGDLMYLDSSATWQKTDADALSTTTGLLGIALSVAASGAPVLVALPGSMVYATAFPTMTPGAPMYVGETPGAISASIPTGADNAVRVVGFAIHADKVFFQPSSDTATIVA